MIERQQPGRKVWITRAMPGADETAARLAALGHTPLIAPLLAVRAIAARIDLGGVGALAFTSRNGVTAFAALTAARALPVFTVGDATARAARAAGFASVRSADGDLSALATLIRTEGAGLCILNPTAAEPAGDLAALVGDPVRIRSVAVYRTVATGAAPPHGWETVLIHSPRAARILAGSRPEIRGRCAVALSPAAAAPLATLDFAEVRIAAAPTEDALMDALAGSGVSALGNPGPGV
jgi:uroporphyrinogen-III synthase